MHHLLVGLQISDEEGYARYRDGMVPILARHGGAFVLDVEGDQVHAFPDGFEPGRVLVIGFPSAEAARGFYADPTYIEVRRRWFEPSVQATHKVVLG